MFGNLVKTYKTTDHSETPDLLDLGVTYNAKKALVGGNGGREYSEIGMITRSC